MERTDTPLEKTLSPLTVETGKQGHPAAGGCDTADLPATCGPLFHIFDEPTLRAQCSEYRRESAERRTDILATCGS